MALKNYNFISSCELLIQFLLNTIKKQFHYKLTQFFINFITKINLNQLANYLNHRYVKSSKILFKHYHSFI